MGGKKSEWALIKFTCEAKDGKVKLKSQVVNGSYATEKMLVNNVVFLGLRKSNSGVVTYDLKQKKSGSKIFEGNANYKSHENFGLVQVNDISQPIGENFELQLNM
ncbi:hypothetical protein KFK09_019898 [Dendrobium nobile]|uniref:Uncharacterized protein n=1 Tax=Dendrobium nobile TaxID=94219 RepID=A0A8T3ASE5_DENNO|nr:hypothetical protein KFK09_019898 [Dendrobium nobile]